MQYPELRLGFDAFGEVDGKHQLLAGREQPRCQLHALDPEGNPLYTASSLVFFGVIGVSALRFYMLRDLWLTRKVAGQGRNVSGGVDEKWPSVPNPSPSGPASALSTEALSQSPAWVITHAKQNKNRLPADAYVGILETCQTLDAVVDAETRQPLGDPSLSTSCRPPCGSTCRL